jgi:uncharacterized membrane protein
MTKLSKILNIVLYAILAVTIVFAGLFYLGGDVEGALHKTPVYTDSFLNWGIALVIGTALITFVFEIVRLIINPKNAVRSLVSIAIIALVVFIAYSLSDDTILNLPGYDGSDNVPSMLILSDTFLFTMYFLFGGALLTIIYTEVSRLFR